MEYRPFGRTDLKVSALCLDTVTWSGRNSKQGIFVQVAKAKAVRINLMGAAEMYPVLSCVEIHTSAERITGNWFRRSGDRADWILANKIVGPGNGIGHVHDGNFKSDRQHIVVALDASLERLQTGWLDFYQLHWSERWTDFFSQLGCQHQEESFTLLEEALEMFDEQVRADKIRHIGLSNEVLWSTMTFLRLAEECDWPHAVSVQSPYNLFDRSFEVDLVEIAIHEQCGLLAYSSMAFGMLSGKYVDGTRPADMRISLYSRLTCYTNPQAEAACARYMMLTREYGLEPARMALAYVALRPLTTSNIIGATLLERLEASLSSVDLRLDEEALTGTDATHREQPNPAP